MDMPKVGEFCWNELATNDVNAAKDFYGNLLGWTFSEHKTDDSIYTMIKHKDGEFGGMWQIPNEQKNQIPPHWMGYILVDDIESTLNNATKLGATVKMPVTQVGEMGRFIVIADPTGAHIAFWQTLNQK
ncbi:27 kDa antigen Cfp30B [Legionella massiliensis]|uniref:27 kDa antigen Cfp30B n=2 Tax=Legionella massiliensis TaxID=1034943 RepID=A0A078KTI2_9GAMM|nr:VOC family protein [Legionella massiliensis]CDZ76272.1 27 kDa antigen Cfp30B [Legionella massiliensis]CEE12010.1 27 kDa antigen Cfp30B [Legionella massiliensis]